MKIIASLIILAALAAAQSVTPFPIIGEKWEQKFSPIPGSPTAIVNVDVVVNVIQLANASGSSVTVSFVDQSTACSGGPCTIWPAVSMAANSVYIAVTNAHVVGGLKWSASTSSAVIGYVNGSYTRSIVAEARPMRRRLDRIAAALRRKHPPVPEEVKLTYPPLIQVFGTK